MENWEGGEGEGKGDGEWRWRMGKEIDAVLPVINPTSQTKKKAGIFHNLVT